MPSHRIVETGIGLIPQGRRILPSLSVRENILIAQRARGSGWDIEKVFSLFPLLRARVEHKGNKLSGGEQQMLTTGRALVGNPELLLLDEPSEGLAPLLVQELGRVFGQLKATGLSMLLVEQNLTLVKKLADYVYVMMRGSIVYESLPQHLWEDKAITARYLGV